MGRFKGDETRAGYLPGFSRLPGDSDTFHPADQGPVTQLSYLFPFSPCVRPELLQSSLCPLASNCHIQGFVSGVHLRQPVLALSSKVSTF